MGQFMKLAADNHTVVYRHTQIGVLPIVLMTTVALFCVGLALKSAHPLGPWLLSGLFAAIGIAFSSLTVRVTPDGVEYFYGPGVYRGRIPMREIASVEQATTSPGEGWGIRITFEGPLYNISGAKAVRIHLRSGKKLRIGTDDPAALANAISTSAAAAASS
jgi:hypothetical protein